MKISLNWLKDFVAVEESPRELADILTQTGLEVEGIEEVHEVQGGLEGIVLGTVVSCKPHPNADRLKLTKVDVGDEELNIVCGAPNVDKDQKVAVALVGATIYPSGQEPLTIKKAKIRGEASEGMICAEDELGLGTDHEGIMVLNTDLPDGTPAAVYFNPQSDKVLEIGLTPNRGDAASHYGVARDLAALTGRKLHYPLPGKFHLREDRPIRVTVEDAQGCPRYAGVTIRGVKVQPSPDWLQWRLRRVGVEPINNVVDVTNYIAHGLGQPLHAFDAAAIEGEKVVVKTLPGHSTFVTLDKKERKLHPHDLMICHAYSGMCMAGVFGGLHSGVTAETTDIFLESAYFDPDYIRNTVQRHGLSTDASFRFERGTDPEKVLDALKVATSLMLEVAGGSLASDFIDAFVRPIKPVEIATTFANFDRLIGKPLGEKKIVSTLQALDIEVKDLNETGFTAVVPAYRNDVTREADLVEEVLRIYGFNEIPLSDCFSTSFLAESKEVTSHGVQQRLSHYLAGKGYHEMINNSLVHPAYPAQLPIPEDGEAVEILNKSSEELAFMRPHAIHSGLEVIRHNINRRNTNLKLFERGRIYWRKAEVLREKEFLTLFLTGHVEEDNWLRPNHESVFHDLLGVVEDCIDAQNHPILDYRPLKADPTFSYGLSISKDQKVWVRLGRVKPTLLQSFNIDQDVFYAEVDWQMLLEQHGRPPLIQPLSRYPEVKRDLSLVIDQSVNFNQIETIARKSAKQLLQRINVFSVFEGKPLEVGKKSYALSFYLQDEEKTLTEKQIDKVMKGLMSRFEKEAGAVIRK